MDEANRLVIQHLDTLRVPVHIICQVREELVHKSFHRPTASGYAALQESPRESFLMRLVPTSDSRKTRALQVHEKIPKIDTSVVSACFAGGVQFTPSSGSTVDSSRIDSSRCSTARDMVWHKIVRRARKHCGSPEEELHKDNIPAKDDTRAYIADAENVDDGDEFSDLAPDAEDDLHVTFSGRRQVSERLTSFQMTPRKASTRKYKSLIPHNPFARRQQKNKGYVSLAEESPMDWRWSPLYGLQNLSPRVTPRGGAVWRPRQFLRALKQVVCGIFDCLEPLNVDSARSNSGRRSTRSQRKGSKEAVYQTSPRAVSEHVAHGTLSHTKYEDLGSIRKSLSLSTVPHLSMDIGSKPSVQHFNMDVGSNSSATGESDYEGVASEAGSNRFSASYAASEQLATRVPRVPQVATGSEAVRQQRSRRSLQPSREAISTTVSGPVGVSSFTSCSSQGDREWEAASLSGMPRVHSLDDCSSEGGQTLKPSQSQQDTGFSTVSATRVPQAAWRALPLHQLSLPPPLILQQEAMPKIRAPPTYQPSPRMQQVESADAGAGAPSREVTMTLRTSAMEGKVMAAPSMSPRDGQFCMSDADDDAEEAGMDDPWAMSEDSARIQTRIQGWETGKPIIIKDSTD